MLEITVNRGKAGVVIWVQVNVACTVASSGIHLGYNALYRKILRIQIVWGTHNPEMHFFLSIPSKTSHVE